jgi:hypothetical protein
MPTSLYRMRTGATQTMPGRELLDTLETLGDAFARAQRIFDALTQEQDGATGTDTDFVTPANIYGFVDAQDTVSPATAHQAYLELNAFLSASGPALEQCCARFKQ